MGKQLLAFLGFPEANSPGLLPVSLFVAHEQGGKQRCCPRTQPGSLTSTWQQLPDFLVPPQLPQPSAAAGSNTFRPQSTLESRSVVSQHLCTFISLLAAITNYHKQRGLYNRNVSPHNSAGRKSDVKVSTRPCLLRRGKGESTPCLSPSIQWFAGYL